MFNLDNTLAKTLGFQRPEREPEKTAQTSTADTSVAAPRMPPDLNSTLTGYEREIRSRVERCMRTRAR